MALTLDYPYNQNLAKLLSQYTHMWEPMQTNTFIRQRSGGAMYAMPGSSATYPMLDMISQRIYDEGRPSKGEALMKVRPTRPVAPSTRKKGGAKAKKLTQKQLAHEIALALNEEMAGGAIDWERVRQIANPYLKKGITMGLNVGVPALSKAIGQAIGGKDGAVIGEIIGKHARALIKSKTGYAREMDGGNINWGKLKKKTKPYVSAGLDAVVPGVGGLVGSVVEPGAGTVVGTLAGQLAREGIRQQTGYGRSGGINLSKIKKKTKPYVSAGLDAVVPGVGGLLGSVVEPGAGTVVGTLAGQLAHEGIKQTTGYGRKSKDVGVYKGGAKAKPKAKPRAKANSGGRNRRNEIVKRIMREKGMSLPQASSYVKQNNLY